MKAVFAASSLLQIIILGLFLAFWLRVPLSSYFSQDDFFHISLVMDKKYWDIPSFFVDQLPGQTFYRPVSRETYNLLMYQMFKLNSWPYHLVNLLLILLNSLLMVFIIRKLTKNLLVVYLSVFVFIISSVHSIELYYLSSVQTMLSTSLVLAALYYYALYIKRKYLAYFLSSLLLFSLSLFCHESAIILPLILLIIEVLLVSRFNFKSLIIHLGPFLLLAGLFFISSSSIVSLPSQVVYQPVFSLKAVLNTLGWYIAWCFGIPETLVDFVEPNLKIRSQFIIWYNDYVKIIFPLIFSIISTLFMFLIFFRNSLRQSKFFILSVLGFLISLLPFLFFPQHKFIYYLSLASIWFSLCLGIILSTAWRYSIIYKSVVVLVIFALAIVFNRTIEFNAKTHWAAKRAAAAKFVIDDLRKTLPTIDREAVFYIVDDPSYPNIATEWGTSSKQASYILSGEDALKLLYNKSSIKVYYEGLGGLPTNIDENKVIKVMAKFPY